MDTVLFPGGLLSLRVFEPRYVDLISQCHTESRPFGAIALQGSNAASPGDTPSKRGIEAIGVAAELIESKPDTLHPGVLLVRCRGVSRFKILSVATTHGLQEASVESIPEDDVIAPNVEFLHTVQALASAIGSLKSQGNEPFLSPFHFDNAGWVANRWCELLPISREAKQRLMELTDPTVRLKLVDQFLRSNGVIGAG